MSYGFLLDHELSHSDANIIARFTTPIKLISNEPTQYSSTLDYRRVYTMQYAQRWELEVMVEASTHFKLLAKLCRSLAGGDLFIRFPQPLSCKANDQYSVTWNPSLAPWDSLQRYRVGVVQGAGSFPNLSRGDFFTFGTEAGAKVYTVVSASGNDLAFWPPLMKGWPSQGATPLTIHTGDHCVMRVELAAGSLRGVTVESGILTNYGTLRLQEVL